MPFKKHYDFTPTIHNKRHIVGDTRQPIQHTIDLTNINDMENKGEKIFEDVGNQKARKGCPFQVN